MIITEEDHLNALSKMHELNFRMQKNKEKRNKFNNSTVNNIYIKSNNTENILNNKKICNLVSLEQSNNNKLLSNITKEKKHNFLNTENSLDIINFYFNKINMIKSSHNFEKTNSILNNIRKFNDLGIENSYTISPKNNCLKNSLGKYDNYLSNPLNNTNKNSYFSLIHNKSNSCNNIIDINQPNNYRYNIQEVITNQKINLIPNIYRSLKNNNKIYSDVKLNKNTNNLINSNSKTKFVSKHNNYYKSSSNKNNSIYYLSPKTAKKFSEYEESIFIDSKEDKNTNIHLKNNDLSFTSQKNFIRSKSPRPIMYNKLNMSNKLKKKSNLFYSKLINNLQLNQKQILSESYKQKEENR